MRISDSERARIAEKLRAYADEHYIEPEDLCEAIECDACRGDEAAVWHRLADLIYQPAYYDRNNLVCPVCGSEAYCCNYDHDTFYFECDNEECGAKHWFDCDVYEGDCINFDYEMEEWRREANETDER